MLPPVHWETLSCLSPQVIVGAFARIVRAVFFEYALEYFHVTGSHIDDLEANVESGWVNVIVATPFTTRDEIQGCFVGNICCELNTQSKILPAGNFLLAVKFKSSRADIGKITNDLLGRIIQDLHVVGKVTAVDFSFVSHKEHSFILGGKYKTILSEIQQATKIKYSCNVRLQCGISSLYCSMGSLGVKSSDRSKTWKQNLPHASLYLFG